MKKRCCIAGVFILLAFQLYGQETGYPLLEDQAELIAEKEESETDTNNEAELMRLESLITHKINLNYAEAAELEELPFITIIQIVNLLEYRKTLGAIENIYELQAIPGWHPEFIRKLLPFITISEKETLAGWKEKLKGGNNNFLARGAVAEFGSRDSDTVNKNSFRGSADKLMLRYKYQFGKELQFGFQADKDAGEKIEFKNRKPGFDFLSVHLFFRNIGKIKQLAIGDYTINLGQGLIQWQSLSFAKSAEITSVKKQAEKIRPYTSAGEFNFHRGLALQLKHKNIYTMLFFSNRNLSSNIVSDSVTSILSFGLHRTQNEMEKRNNLNMKVAGFSTGYRTNRFLINANGAGYLFSTPLTKANELYNAFAIRGKEWWNLSTDYSFTIKNIHLFGEAATDKNFNTAFINGALLALHRNLNLSLLYRKISPGYQAMFTTAFTENSKVNNETGFFIGINLQPANTLKIDAFSDIFYFPWLKFRVGLPSNGHEQMLRITYKPNRKTEFYTRFLYRQKQQNSASLSTVYYLENIVQRSFRSHLSYQVSNMLTLKQRIEVNYVRTGEVEETGFLFYTDISFTPPGSFMKMNFRVQYSAIDGYNSRIYAYETDLPGSSRVIANNITGYRIYGNFSFNMKTLLQQWKIENKGFQLAFRPSFTVHNNKSSNLSSQIKGKNILPDIKFQLIYKW